MHRLFVAIRPPSSVRQRLMALSTGIPGARWQSDDQLHLTLRFIGEVDRHMASDIAAVLGSIHHPSMELALSGLGQFDRKRRIEALWAGVTPHDRLKSLHNKIDQALVRIGLPAEQRAYLPHITLARFSRGTAPIALALPPPPMPAGEPFLVSEFHLMESDLGAGGAIYSTVERYPLG